MPLSPGDDWEELEEAAAFIQHDGLNIDRVWAAVGQGDDDRAARELAKFYDFDEYNRIEVFVAATPDDIVGDLYRIWIRPK